MENQEAAAGKTKISQIKMLKQVLKRWKSKTKPGSLAVYVGPDRTRFLIPARFLNLPIFAALLHKAEEEYGFKFSGGIALPCEVGFFKKLLEVLHKDEKKYGKLAVEELLRVVSDSDFHGFSCKQEEQGCFFSASPHRHGFNIPLIIHNS